MGDENGKDIKISDSWGRRELGEENPNFLFMLLTEENPNVLFIP